MTLALAACLGVAAMPPALPDSYPVSGRWGVSDSTQESAIDCTGKRVITVKGEQCFDTDDGVPGYHNQSVETDGIVRGRIIDQFTTGQVRAATTSMTLTKIDHDHMVLDLQGVARSNCSAVSEVGQLP